MKKYFDPEAELIEIDALISTGIDVSETQGEPGAGGGDENVTSLWDN